MAIGKERSVRLLSETKSEYAVELRGIRKSFGTVDVLRGLDVKLKRGEVLALLGPSGCGKSTALNIIAGFLPADEGEVILEGRLANHVPAHKRQLGMVFQDFSLFPHKNVFQNVAFGLSVRREPSSQIQERVLWALNLVRLPGIAERFPAQLSGGQQQRVAVARALVVNPKLLLLDEPLSNLDARLRKEMEVELKEIQEATNVTIIYVTHDQTEAITIADRIALMDRGNVEQLGNPYDLFEHPRTQFAAHFLGFSNFLSGRIKKKESEGALVELADGRLIMATDRTKQAPSAEVLLAIREDRIICDQLVSAEDEDAVRVDGDAYLEGGQNRFMGRIEESIYGGGSYVMRVRCGDDVHLRVNAPVKQFAGHPPAPDMLVTLVVPRGDVLVLPKSDEGTESAQG